MKTYFQHISDGIRTTIAGMKLTVRHLWAARARRSQNNVREDDYFNQQNGMVTLQYPMETMPIPDNGRYRLHNEMDDCIVCDKCAKVCPVDCIDIEPIKATSEVGKASDGSPIRLYAATFDIDMAKCCYCGLCTTVCPTECLTMTKTFDYSEFDVRDMNYHYANLSPEQAEEKKSLYEQFVKEKEELKRMSEVGSQKVEVGSQKSEMGEQKKEVGGQKEEIQKPKPSFKPTIKPSIIPKIEEAVPEVNAAPTLKPKPVFAPKKPVESPPLANVELPQNEQVVKPKPIFKPTKPKAEATSEITTEPQEPIAKPKPIFKPTMKPPVVEKATEDAPKIGNTDPGEATPRPKPVFKPTMRPKKEE